MTDNQLKLEVLRMALDTARETMYARRTEVENGWAHRVTETPYPRLPTLDLGEVVTVYQTLIGAVKL
jgi:hypothetical protein